VTVQEKVGKRVEMKPYRPAHHVDTVTIDREDLPEFIRDDTPFRPDFSKPFGRRTKRLK
jgi:hypothetical protein